VCTYPISDEKKIFDQMIEGLMKLIERNVNRLAQSFDQAD
jgi:hypothetical protein